MDNGYLQKPARKQAGAGPWEGQRATQGQRESRVKPAVPWWGHRVMASRPRPLSVNLPPAPGQPQGWNYRSLKQNPVYVTRPVLLMAHPPVLGHAEMLRSPWMSWIP